MKAELVPDNGDPAIPIVRDVTIVGRREYCDVVINHHSLSKRHCVLVKTDGLLVIRDLATTNGTKVKGQKVRWAALLPDDRITLGGYKMRVYLGPDDMPAPSEQSRVRGRAGIPAGRGVANGARVADRPAAAPIAPWPVPAVAGRPAVVAGFPEPSKSQITAMPEPDQTRAAPPGREDAGLPDRAEFRFEVLDDDDDDEIIDLE
jgi:hypothetical protein